MPNAVYREQICTCVSVAKECVYSNEAGRPATASIIKRLDEVDDKARGKLTSEVQVLLAPR